jgi:hypothetical protein
VIVLNLQKLPEESVTQERNVSSQSLFWCFSTMSLAIC